MPPILTILFILLVTFITLASFANGSPGILTFTVTNAPPHTMVRRIKVQHICGARNPVVTIEPKPTAPMEFPVDWTDCISKGSKASVLKDAKIQVDLTLDGKFIPIVINLSEYSFGLMRLLYGGGKANIVISENGQSAKIEYVEDVNGKSYVPSEVLIFNVEYECGKGKKILSVQNVEVDNCVPLYDGTKFALDLADCRVYDTQDLAELKFVVTFLLQHIESGRSELETRKLSLKSLKKKSEGHRKKFYEGGVATVVFSDSFSDRDDRNRNRNRIYHNGPNEASTSTAQDVTAHKKNAGWIGPTEIAFSVDETMFGESIVQHANGKLGVSKKVKTIKLVNEREMKMHKAGEGPECPLKIVENKARSRLYCESTGRDASRLWWKNLGNWRAWS